MESTLIKFIASLQDEGMAPATQQLYFAAVRSFFEIHYYPLKMRRGDYPKGDSIGVRVANKEAILKTLDHKHTRNKEMINAAILFLKDSGLRISDARLMNVGELAEQINKKAELIAITKITQKTKLTAKTFIGYEAIQAIKKYLELRQKGSRRVPPEKITDKSPLFRTWTTGTVKRIPRGSFSSLIRNAFLRVEEQNITAHSLRKYLQTNLEAAGINPNWIDQILGHQLINSRDAYSKPTDEQLREAYAKSYKFLKVLPETSAAKAATKIQINKQSETTTKTENDEYTVKAATNIQEATELIEHGYEHSMTIDGTMLFKKRK